MTVTPCEIRPSTTSRRIGRPLKRPQSLGCKNTWPSTTEPGEDGVTANRPVTAGPSGVNENSYRRHTSPPCTETSARAYRLDPSALSSDTLSFVGALERAQR